MKKNNDINTADISPLVYRQAIRNVKVLITAIVGETVVIVALVILLIALFPLKEKEVAYTIVEDATDKIVTTIKPGETYTGDQQLVDYFVKKYVKERETWDGITDHQRYRYTFDVTGDKIKDRLNTAINHYNNKYEQSTFKRSIEIVRVSTLTSAIRQVEFKTNDEEKRGGKYETSTGSWVATLKISFGDRKTEYENKDINPLHLTVEEYSIESRKESK